MKINNPSKHKNHYPSSELPKGLYIVQYVAKEANNVLYCFCYCIGAKESNILAGNYKQLIQLCIVTVHVPLTKIGILRVENIVQYKNVFSNLLLVAIVVP